MRRLFIFFISLHLTHCSCPAGFELVRDGECRGNYTRINSFYDQATSDAIAKCKLIDGQPIIIHDEEHQSYWKNQVAGVGAWTVIGLVCNPVSKHWEWADGSPLDYKPAPGFYNGELDNSCMPGQCWVMRADGYWTYDASSHAPFATDVFCTTQLQLPSLDGCDSFEVDGEDGVCYQVGAVAESWSDAQAICQSAGANLASIHNSQENSFLRRLAVSKGAVNGLFLGAKYSFSSSYFEWIDGSYFDYRNFNTGYPQSDSGDCLAMDTADVSGQWRNVDCDSKLPIACVRDKRAVPQITCNSGPYYDGGFITSPGYPYSASTPCDFVLSVGAGKSVQIDVSLEANSCCDTLLIYDGYFPDNALKSFTGEVRNETFTISSNLMVVSWLPKGGVNVRGFALGFRGV